MADTAGGAGGYDPVACAGREQNGEGGGRQGCKTRAGALQGAVEGGERTNLGTGRWSATASSPARPAGPNVRCRSPPLTEGGTGTSSRTCPRGPCCSPASTAAPPHTAATPRPPLPHPPATPAHAASNAANQQPATAWAPARPHARRAAPPRRADPPAEGAAGLAYMPGGCDGDSAQRLHWRLDTFRGGTLHRQPVGGQPSRIVTLGKGEHNGARWPSPRPQSPVLHELQHHPFCFAGAHWQVPHAQVLRTAHLDTP